MNPTKEEIEDALWHADNLTNPFADFTEIILAAAYREAMAEIVSLRQKLEEDEDEIESLIMRNVP